MKKRIISAILLILIFIPFVIIGKLPFTLLVGVLSLLALKEMFDLDNDIPFFLKVIGYIISIFLISYSYACNYDFVNYKVISIIFILYNIMIVVLGNLKKFNYLKATWMIFNVLMITILFYNLIIIRNYGIYYIVYIFLISTMTDTFALLCGKYFGKKKLSKNISPNKTIAGSVGGSLIGTVIPTIFYLLFIDKSGNILVVCLVTLILTIIGQIGDLYFSSIKRNYGVKDFSNLIPGHGGVLDRFDSTLFVASGLILALMVL